MTDRIEPALTPEEWEQETHSIAIGADECIELGNAAWSARLIALANAALPDTDPRKITRATVAMLRNAGAEQNPANDPYESDQESPYATELRALADALESYLPPT